MVKIVNIAREIYNTGSSCFLWPWVSNDILRVHPSRVIISHHDERCPASIDLDYHTRVQPALWKSTSKYGEKSFPIAQVTLDRWRNQLVTPRMFHSSSTVIPLPQRLLANDILIAILRCCRLKGPCRSSKRVPLPGL